MDIFISYRRRDTAGYALGLKREFARALPDAKIFLDVESLDAGMRWRDVIRQHVELCDLMLVVIGDEWLVTRDGNKKIDSDDDPVRFELETGLARPGMAVIPILVEDASMPAARDLPEAVRPLCEYNSHAIHDRTYDQDLNTLVERLLRLSEEHEPDESPENRPNADLPAPESAYPSKITDRYLRQEVSGMGRDQLLALIAELLRRGWSHHDVFEEALRFSPLKPANKVPARVTVAWLATNVPLLSPNRVTKLIKELRGRGWSEADIRTHVLGSRQPGLASPIPSRIAVPWVERNAPLMTADEQDELAAVLKEKGWSPEEIFSYLPNALVGD